MNPRVERLKTRVNTRMSQERADLFTLIRQRHDYNPDLDPFLTVLDKTQTFSAFRQTTNQKIVSTLCVQAPLALFHAADIRPFRISCGSHVSGDMAPVHLPALTCPMIRSGLGQLGLEPPGRSWVIPLTCDWVVRFRDLAGLNQKSDVFFLDLPHLREAEEAFEKWLDQIRRLKIWLENQAGKKIRPKDLALGLQVYAKGFEMFDRLLKLRRQKIIPALHFALIIHAMPYQNMNEWIALVESYLKTINRVTGTALPGVPVFLTGSPIAYPNYKVLNLIEKTGMLVTADDLCSMERSFPAPAPFRDRSEYSLLSALSQTHHKACSCPTFADNHRRISTLISTMDRHGIKGVIFHLLKGCHPFDIEAGLLEQAVRSKGYRFLKIETDYVKEDEQNILTRLEAFKRTLEA